MIGVYDSGLGGILELNKIRQDNPYSTIIYLGDQENAPYGNKEQAELLRIFDANLAKFQKLKIDNLILACNTLCSVVDLKKDHGLKIYDLIENTCLSVDPCMKKVLVFGTKQTVKIGRYQRILEKRGHIVQAVSLDDLAYMLENFIDPKIIQNYLDKIFQMITFEADAIVLACTHYPIVNELFEQYFHVPIYDSRHLNFNLALNDKECAKIYVLMKESLKNAQFLKKYVAFPYEFVSYEELVDRFRLTP